MSEKAPLPPIPDEKERSHWDALFGKIGENVQGNEDIRAAIREALWFRAEGYVNEYLSGTNVEPVTMERLPSDVAHAMGEYRRGRIDGIRLASLLLTDKDELREVRDSIQQASEKKEF